MAKVLISFIGTGPLVSKGGSIEEKSAREYRTASYHLGEENLGEYSFMAAALCESQQIDKVILIGTVHSMWEEVYRYFQEKNGKPVDEDVYCEIAEHCEATTSKSELYIPRVKEIEAAIGKDAHLYLIRYGVNEQEINENINIILSLNQLLSTGDELIVDVTHSFRSLPITIMNLLLYLRNVSSRSIKISHIYYGMIEMNKEYGYAPIVDLTKILKLNDWIVGAMAFKQYGNAYQIAELIQQENPDVTKRLKHFSDVMNLNHLYGISQETQSLRALTKKDFSSQLPELIVKPVVGDFLRNFQNTENDPALFQYKLACWQYRHMNYTAALISLQESILTYVCLREKHNPFDKDERQLVKDRICNDQDFLPYELRGVYFAVTKNRNVVAHALESERSSGEIIDNLRKSLETVGKYIL